MMWCSESDALIAIKVKSITINFIIKPLSVFTFPWLCPQFERDDIVTALQTHFLSSIRNKYRACIHLVCTSYFLANNKQLLLVEPTGSKDS